MYIYVMRDEPHNITKIGITKNPKERITTLVRNYPFNSLKPLLLVDMDDAKLLEAEIKEEYKEFKSNGEYYNIDSKEILQYIKISKYPVNAIVYNVEKYIARNKSRARITPAQRKSASKKNK